MLKPNFRESFYSGKKCVYLTMILTGNQIELLNQLPFHQIVELQADLGTRIVRCRKCGDVIRIGDVEIQTIALKEIRREEDALYLLDEQEAVLMKIQLYDERTARYYRLVNCGDDRPPTVEISGVKMHVTEGQDPFIDTRKKLGSYRRPLSGNILDTCCGLGYTTLHAARVPSVRMVIVLEKDQNIISLCRLNPYSQSLFAHPKISLLQADASDMISAFPDHFFHFVIHDPPRFALAPELYSVHFYRELARVMKKGGELYHYTGNPNQSVRRQSLQTATMQRLKEAGFGQVKKAYQGVWARR